MKTQTLLLLSLLVLTGCMSQPAHTMDMQHDMTITSEEQFVVEMIPHHQEAVDTSELVFANTENEEMKSLTSRIISEQKTEIEMMNGWVADWYDGGYEATYMKMMPDLLSVEGDDRDRAYLEGMIEHHEMAVTMAEDVLDLEPRQEVAEFALGVIAVQSAEIREMEALLG